MEIWRTGANGKLGEQTANMNRNNKTVGRYTHKTNRARRRAKILNICEAQKRIPMNTWGRQRLTIQERDLLQNRNNQERGRKLGQIQKEKTITWESVDGRIQGQIDYILLNLRFRNSARFAQTSKGWGGSMHQSRKQNVAQGNIWLGLMKTTTLKTPQNQEQNGIWHSGNE